MPVLAAALDSELSSRIVEVTTRMVLAYAAGVGEVGDFTFDDTRERLIAPPAFCAALEWPVVSGQRGTLLGLSADERRRLVHVEQDSTFHRPISPGDSLRVGGRIVGIRATGAGALVQVELRTEDALDGTPVAMTWYAAICRGVGVQGEGGASRTPPPCPKGDAAPASAMRIPVPRQAAHVYTECSGIWNPIHSERRAALAAGLPDVVLHGTATWALAGRELVRLYAGCDPTRLRRLRARFTAPVIPGRPLTLRHRGSHSGQEVRFSLHDVDDQNVAEGFAVFSNGRGD